MNWAMIGAIGELLGAAAVVVSLVYLARQLKVGAQHQARTQYFELNKEFVAFGNRFAQDPEWADLFLRGSQDFSTLTPVEIMRYNGGLHGLFRAYEAMFMYSREGGVHNWGVDDFRANMSDVLGLPGVQAFWASRQHWYTDDGFRADVDEMIRTTVPSPLLESWSPDDGKTPEG